MNEFSDPKPIASRDEFKVALLAVENEISETDKAMLKKQHDNTPKHMISAEQLKKEFNHSHLLVTCGHYGRLARKIADALHYVPGPFKRGGSHWWFALSTWNDDSPKGQDQWIMRPELAQALQELKWI